MSHKAWPFSSIMLCTQYHSFANSSRGQLQILVPCNLFTAEMPFRNPEPDKPRQVNRTCARTHWLCCFRRCVHSCRKEIRHQLACKYSLTVTLNRNTLREESPRLCFSTAKHSSPHLKARNNFCFLTVGDLRRNSHTRGREMQRSTAWEY